MSSFIRSVSLLHVEVERHVLITSFTVGSGYTSCLQLLALFLSWKL